MSDNILGKKIAEAKRPDGGEFEMIRAVYRRKS